MAHHLMGCSSYSNHLPFKRLLFLIFTVQKSFRRKHIKRNNSGLAGSFQNIHTEIPYNIQHPIIVQALFIQKKQKC